MRKVITLITWSDLYLSCDRPGDRESDWPSGRGSQQAQEPALLLAAETTLKIKTQRSKEARDGEHRDARLPGRYISRGFS